jgi:hypothetical protein
MVSRSGSMRAQGQRGKTGKGCLLTLLVFAVAGYYGVGAGQAYLRYYQMLDEMKSQARLGPGLDDAVIRRRLVTKAQELELPGEATKFIIKRLARPREMVITTRWQETIELPFYHWVVTLRPEARALL